MNMGDDLHQCAVQISMKVAESGVHIIADLIGKLIQQIQTDRIRKSVDKDITGMKPGKTSLTKLIKNARENGESIATSKNGLSDADVKAMEALSKKYGIPVAFNSTKGQEPHYPCVKQSDLPIFKMMCTDMMREKMNTIPRDLGNFKCNDWEIPFITSELNKYNLNAQFGSMKNGEYFCMYDKQDEKAILIARSEFLKKHKELSNEILFSKEEPDEAAIDRDENGLYTIKNLKTGKEISFDSSKSYKEISKMLQREFDFDENKANMCASKFGVEMLEGENKDKYFSASPINDFKSIKTNIKFEEDDIYCSQYNCMRVVPKEDEVSRIVFVNDSGKFALISFDMTLSEKENEFTTKLGITDKKEIQSLIDKSDRAFLYYEQQKKLDNKELFNLSLKFDKSNFDMSDVETVSGMKRESDGHIYTRSVPLDEIKIKINRVDQNLFRINSKAIHNETDEAGKTSKSVESRVKTFSFSDKKKALHEMEMLLIAQGVPQTIASRTASDTFAKAQKQDAERIAAIEEVRVGTENYSTIVEATVVTAGEHINVDLTDTEKGINQIKEALDIPEEEAAQIHQKAYENSHERQFAILRNNGIDPDELTSEERWETVKKISENKWKLPEGFSVEGLREELANRSISLDTVKNTVDDLADGISDALEDADEIISVGAR